MSSLAPKPRWLASRRNLPLNAQLDDGALHMAVVLGTLSSGMLDADKTASAEVDNTASVEIADATSYEDYGNELFGDISFLELELAADEPYVPRWKTHIVESGETFALLAQNKLGLGYSEVMALLEDLPGSTYAYSLAYWPQFRLQVR